MDLLTHYYYHHTFIYIHNDRSRCIFRSLQSTEHAKVVALRKAPNSQLPTEHGKAHAQRLKNLSHADWSKKDREKTAGVFTHIQELLNTKIRIFLCFISFSSSLQTEPVNGNTNNNFPFSTSVNFCLSSWRIDFRTGRLWIVFLFLLFFMSMIKAFDRHTKCLCKHKMWMSDNAKLTNEWE
jgi:hypothetical protein